MASCVWRLHYVHHTISYHIYLDDEGSPVVHVDPGAGAGADCASAVMRSASVSDMPGMPPPCFISLTMLCSLFLIASFSSSVRGKMAYERSESWSGLDSGSMGIQTGFGASVLKAIGGSSDSTKSYASWTVGNSMTSLEVLIRRRGMLEVGFLVEVGLLLEAGV
ncbi:hypothetical protein EDD21DRAFT_382095 [Dissophora ornata]|nr:hypothetical protein EDD21DRAFT_382095 [Dissophora ornata]